MSRTLAVGAAATVLGAVALVLQAPPGAAVEIGVVSPATAAASVPGLWGNAADPGAALPTATTPAEVRRVVQATRNPIPAHEPELRRLALHAQDPLVAGNALRALARLGPLDQDQELLALLTDARPRVPQELVMALGQPGRVAALPVLTGALQSRDRTLRCLALLAIGRVGGQEASALLERVASDPAVAAEERIMARLALR
jgi:hypothetical protein